MQNKVRMAKNVEGWNGLQYGFLKHGLAEQFSKIISFACDLK